MVWNVETELELLVKEFGDCVQAQTQCIEMGHATEGNKYAKRYLAAFQKLRSHGNTGRSALAVLLEDSRPEVRVMAASFLLRHSEEKAKAVLSAAANGVGLIAFGAQQALERWNDGTWTLDPE